jgi:hypothetical protein
MTDRSVSPAARHAKTVIAGVVVAAVRDRGASGIVLLEAGSPQGRLVRGWLTDALGADRVVSVEETEAPASGPIEPAERERAAGRVMARRRDMLLAHPACKTVLFLSSDLPPERLLPLGDLYAATVSGWAGGLALPDDVATMAENAGGVDRLDRVLRAWLDERRSLEQALTHVPGAAREQIAERLHRNRSLRRWPRCVPKLGRSTLWIDVFV